MFTSGTPDVRLLKQNRLIRKDQNDCHHSLFVHCATIAAQSVAPALVDCNLAVSAHCLAGAVRPTLQESCRITRLQRQFIYQLCNARRGYYVGALCRRMEWDGGAGGF